MLTDPSRAGEPPQIPPFGRYVSPQQVAVLTGFLLSDGAASLTGQNMVACGGAYLGGTGQSTTSMRKGPGSEMPARRARDSAAVVSTRTASTPSPLEICTQPRSRRRSESMSAAREPGFRTPTFVSSQVRIL